MDVGPGCMKKPVHLANDIETTSMVRMRCICSLSVCWGRYNSSPGYALGVPKARSRGWMPLVSQLASRDSNLICQRTPRVLGRILDKRNTNTKNEDPLRFVRFDSAEFIRIPTHERKLEPAHFCLPSRLNAMLQMMLDATALRSHDASNTATTLSR